MTKSMHDIIANAFQTIASKIFILYHKTEFIVVVSCCYFRSTRCSRASGIMSFIDSFAFAHLLNITLFSFVVILISKFYRKMFKGQKGDIGPIGLPGNVGPAGPKGDSVKNFFLFHTANLRNYRKYLTLLLHEYRLKINNSKMIVKYNILSLHTYINLC